MTTPHLAEHIHIEDVAFKALSKDPKHRFDSLEDFATALEGACRLEYQSRASSRILLPPSPVLPIPPTYPALPVELVPQMGTASLTPHSSESSLWKRIVASRGTPIKGRLWSLNRYLAVRSVLGVVLYSIVICLLDVIYQSFTSIRYTLYYSSIYSVSFANLLFCFSRLIPLFFGAVFGPWVGFFTGGAGILVGDSLSGHLSIETWLSALGTALLGFIVGLSTQRTRGRFNRLRSLEIVEVISGLGIVVASAITTLLQLWLFETTITYATRNFLDQALPTFVFGLIMLPVLLYVYNLVTRAWHQHRNEHTA